MIWPREQTGPWRRGGQPLSPQPGGHPAAPLRRFSAGSVAGRVKPPQSTVGTAGTTVNTASAAGRGLSARPQPCLVIPRFLSQDLGSPGKHLLTSKAKPLSERGSQRTGRPPVLFSH